MIAKRRHSGCVRSGAYPVEQPLMAAMNSVEVPDGDDRPSGNFGNVARPVNRDHPRRSPLRKSQVSLDQSVSPSWVSPVSVVLSLRARGVVNPARAKQLEHDRRQ